MRLSALSRLRRSFCRRFGELRKEKKRSLADPEEEEFLSSDQSAPAENGWLSTMRRKRKILFIWCGLKVIFVLFMLLGNIGRQESPIETVLLNEDILSKIQVSKAALSQNNSGDLFCFVLTTKNGFETKVPAINSTWLPKCDHGEFFAKIPLPDQSIPFSTAFHDLNDGYKYLIYKTLRSFDFALSKYPNFKWYFKADDDLYVIVENLKILLNKFDHRKPLYIGHLFKRYLENGYNAGGAGYLLSNSAVRLLIKELKSNRTSCEFVKWEDVGLAKCLEKIYILPTDTRTDRGQHRMLPGPLLETFNGQLNPEYEIGEQLKGFEAFKEDVISFHNVKPEEMYFYHTLINMVHARFNASDFV